MKQFITTQSIGFGYLPNVIQFCFRLLFLYNTARLLVRINALQDELKSVIVNTALLIIYVSCSFVHYQYTISSDNSSGQTYQLLFS